MFLPDICDMSSSEWDTNSFRMMAWLRYIETRNTQATLNGV